MNHNKLRKISFFFFLLYNIVLVLPYINMHPPQVYTCSHPEPPSHLPISDDLICLLRNLYSRQEATVRTGHGTMEWFQIGKGVSQGCMLSPYLFNLYVEYIMQNARLDDSQAGIKIARTNISNLRYADDTILIPDSKE